MATCVKIDNINNEAAILWDKTVTGAEDIKSVKVVRDYGDKTVLVDDGAETFEVNSHDLYEEGYEPALINYKGDKVKAHIITETYDRALARINHTLNDVIIYRSDIIKYLD